MRTRCARLRARWRTGALGGLRAPTRHRPAARDPKRCIRAVRATTVENRKDSDGRARPVRCRTAQSSCHILIGGAMVHCAANPSPVPRLPIPSPHSSPTRRSSRRDHRISADVMCVISSRDYFLSIRTYIHTWALLPNDAKARRLASSAFFRAYSWNHDETRSTPEVLDHGFPCWRPCGAN